MKHFIRTFIRGLVRNSLCRLEVITPKFINPETAFIYIDMFSRTVPALRVSDLNVSDNAKKSRKQALFIHYSFTLDINTTVSRLL